ncbi:alpha-galactosidase [Chitinophaga sp.]|uniref:alpha-galactosidase n=1 Tax=Chitinophaga sp. TaxID=1869181 RepID=UPI002F951979
MKPFIHLRHSIWLFVMGCCGYATAQDSRPLIIPVESKQNAVVLQVDAKGQLSTIYFGAKLSNSAGYQQVPAAYQQTTEYSEVANAAYTAAGSKNLFEPAIAVTHADGNNGLDLRYVSHKTVSPGPDVEETSILLKDPLYPFEVTLHYKVYKAADVIEQWSEIRHQEKGAVTLQKFASANLYLKASRYWLKQYHGDWAMEMQPEESQLTHGIKTLDSKLGTRADLFQPPVFMISLDQPATEDHGSVLYGSVEWSGNFRVDLELDNLDNLRIIAGINNYQSPYILPANKAFETPAFLYTFSTKGKGEASRKLQRWARNYKIPNGNRERLTLLNNWEATYFDFDEAKLKGLLKDTKDLGVDLFLLDDGWFGNKFPRNSDHAGLGDWQENRKKLPNGIGTLDSIAQTNGVKFGIWIEPEMVSPQSELNTKHPEWVLRQPGREEHYFRHQLVLDLSNPKVQDFVFQIIDSLFIKAPKLSYIKWDCNAVIYNAWSAYQGRQSSQLYVEYVRGLYKVLARVRAKYPTVAMMLCSGGGGRVDYGALQYFTEYWPSDNTDPLERIFIQWENSYFYPAIASANHVTDWGKQPIKFRVDVAMMGKLGFDIVVEDLKEKDRTFCQEAITHYTALKDVIWHGDQYRLADPHEGSVAAIMYLDEKQSKGVMFNYLVSSRYGEGSKLPIRLKGLDPAKRYRLKEINLYPGEASSIPDNITFTGEFLMTIGFNPQLNLKRTSVVIQINEAP